MSPIVMVSVMMVIAVFCTKNIKHLLNTRSK
jgi:hypothetical protein